MGDETAASGNVDLILRPGEPPPVEKAFKDACSRAEARGRTTGTPKLGETIAVFAPGAAGIVAHELIGHAREGDVVARHRTWLSDGTRLKGERPVTVIDDPRRGRGAWTIDDEGVATSEVVLLDRGRAAGVLLDRSSAAALGMTATGHGRRSSYLEAVRPRMGCTYIARGGDEPIDILRDTRQGVLIRRLAGGHTDPLTGQATFVVTDADRIEAGSVTHALDPFVIDVGGRAGWESIDRIGHDLAFDTCVGSCVRDGQPLAVSVGAPTIRIGVVAVRS